MTALAVSRIVTAQEFAALEPEWLALERESKNTLPFRTFDWAFTWWRHMREDRLTVKDRLAIHTVRTESGRLVGVAPMMLTQRPGIGPIRTHCLQFMGADPNMTEIRGALCEPELEAACYAALRQGIMRSARTYDWVQWTGIDERYGGCEALRDPAMRWSDGVVCSLVELPGTWDELRASRGRNLKEALRKSYNSLKREGLDFSLEVVTTKPEAGPAINDFFRLHAARAHLDGTIGHKDVFAYTSCRAFLVDVCERFAERGALRVFRLLIGGQLVATRIGFVLADSLYLYYSGFDPAFARFGVMTTTVAEAIKAAIEERLRWVNLSSGRDTWKERWHPQEITYREAIFLSPRALGRAKYEAFGAAERAVMQPALWQYAQRLLARRA
jgi:CelD/BcsL family acetyltransferase involved in cellulose biosynthesis